MATAGCELTQLRTAVEGAVLRYDEIARRCNRALMGKLPGVIPGRSDSILDAMAAQHMSALQDARDQAASAQGRLAEAQQSIEQLTQRVVMAEEERRKLSDHARHAQHTLEQMIGELEQRFQRALESSAAELGEVRHELSEAQVAASQVARRLESTQGESVQVAGQEGVANARGGGNGC